MAARPLLSVVVPFHNVEGYFAECLAALRAQVLTDLEVLLVDDGSTDGSAVLAKAVAAEDRRFRVVRQERLGPGPARNTGARRARGVYLAFADADDVVPSGAYQTLVSSLEGTGSELACGNVRRLTETGPRASAGHALAFQQTVKRSHIRKNHELISDRTVWNKVFRRTFWDEHAFLFPPGHYEDAPVAIQAHVLAKATDVLADVVYHWRITPGSITQRRNEARNVEERLAAMARIARFLRDNAPALARRHDRLVADLDLGILLDALNTTEGADLEHLLDLAGTALRDIHPSALAHQPPIRRLELHLAARRMVDELRHVHRFRRTALKDARIVRRGVFDRRWFADYPYFGDRDKGVPDKVYQARRELVLRAYVDAVTVEDERVTASGYAYLAHLDSARSGLKMWLQSGEKRIPLDAARTIRKDATADSDQSAVCHDRSGFTVTVDLAKLPPGIWTLHARVSARGVTQKGQVLGHPLAGERRYPPVHGLQASLTQADGLTVGPPLPLPLVKALVDTLRWEDGQLVLGGEGPARKILLRGEDERPCLLERDETRFTATIAPPVDRGTWRLVTGKRQPLRAAEGLALPAHRTDLHEYRFRTTLEGDLSLLVAPALQPDERGRYAERRLRGTGKRALRDLIVFDSYGGRLASCNPRAIHEELRRLGTGLESVWVTLDGNFPAPEDSRLVLYGSRAHAEALATARFVVGNRTQPVWFTKRRGQRYLQTWHGTPLKRLGHDLAGLPFQRTELLDWMDRDAPQWDLLLSPNPFSSPILRQAFGYRGEVVEAGYPRNDPLFAPDRDERAREIRRRLGVPAGHKVVLYAPTWRDDLHVGRRRGFTMELDLPRLQQALGDDHTFLVRAHHLITHRPRLPHPTIDVTKYPEISDLYLAADVLVTDYSSAMFDFACTGKPMIFYTYDLERYRDVIRGFYFDFEREAPGPLVRDTDSLIDALRSDHPAYPEFQRKFCPWDDGRAAKRVVDRLLG
ncbi:hypothetical protein Acor_24960 [Acrocarpospora corrugata]|uniref:Glycosyltransferase 2-like domain-containing protein n=1 Tax=Acrocarpospora corrugata TaxID=35763 RepID=A0A5M3VXJ8_9ACTN|nr:bifunctional glycosyltransferase/CDP-glycerol:glycerophosphate glycerophosphotransferase [Acrocarpospora corrugata]GES00432.1 hypothetical protein Acor_24960 [Acrocarpospora corrugata]